MNKKNENFSGTFGVFPKGEEGFYAMFSYYGWDLNLPSWF